MSPSSKIITRFPPSPTGYFHIGSARTALFNYLFTAHNGGVMYLRFEDTDKERGKKEYEDDIIAGLDWLGISYTLAEPLRQSERLSAYRGYLHALIEKGAAYEAEAAEGKGRVVRFKNPNTRITFTDLIRGEVAFDTQDLKDFVIARNIDDPLYHMAVVADDHDMGVTHVIRGEDHISNTPRQILILEALGFERPVYAHIPLILAPDRTKLSKRHGATSLIEYRAQGFAPEALVNYLALLGWNPGGERELFTLSELEKAFTFEHVQKGGAVFDIEKLRWFNHAYLREYTSEHYESVFAEFAKNKGIEDLSGLQHVSHELQQRARTLEEAAVIFTEYNDLRKSPSCSKEMLLKGAKADAAVVIQHLEYVSAQLEALATEGFSKETVKTALFPYATEKGRASVLWPLRIALSGNEKSVDPFTIAGFIGREHTLRRIHAAVAVLKQS